MTHKDALIEKLNDRTARIGIIGLGYVGLPLMLRFAKVGYKVTGFDIDASKVSCLNGGESYIERISLESTTYPGTTEEELRPRIEGQNLKIGSDVFLVFSPEREDPSNPTYETKTIPKARRRDAETQRAGNPGDDAR